MLYVKQPQGTWGNQRDLSYWSLAPTQTSSAERSTLMPMTMRGGLPPSPRQHEDMEDMEMDNPRARSAGPVFHQQQYQQHQQQQQQYQQYQTQQQYTTPQSTPPPPPYQQPHQPLRSQSSPSSSPSPSSPAPAPAPAPAEAPGTYKGLDAAKVAAALEAARDSADGALDPEVSGTLESALSQIWGRVLAQPGSYVMTKGEFAVFNLYQHLFLGNHLATAARRRFWDNTHG
ncbi:hypothetical protein VMCG_07689 [Cytospora schulzeri]|uniref:Uncharacterized protein n=1 Tax=Cytospora schulzeri TaxID=448051 RepID=A0A423VZ06_9PEZI|nr:hypothetical protein VMCG_07689 [Valsa malicola]